MGSLIEDSRQQISPIDKHALKHAYFDSIGECVVRCALPVGDYQRPAKVAVDTKKDIIELGVDVKADHKRFARECEKAQTLGTQLVILVENTDGVKCLSDLETWEESDDSYNKRNVSGKAMRYKGASIAKTCKTMHRLYGVKFGFCHPDDSGRRILEILDAFGG